MNKPLSIVLLLWALPAAAQVELTVRPDLTAGYDSNIYYGAGALPDDNEEEGGPLISFTPRFVLGYLPGGGHRLLLRYDGELRQALTDGLDNETLFQHSAMVGYLSPELSGFTGQVWGSFKHLYVRQLEGGGWLGGSGGALISRGFGNSVLLSLGYMADYTSYDEDSSSTYSELSHRVSAVGTWQPTRGLLATLGYTFAVVDADPDSKSALEHLGGLDLHWDLPWVPLSLRGGYSFMAYMSETEDRTDLIHQGYAEASYRALPWLKVFARWESIWGESSMDEVGTYTRHQGIGGLRFSWGVGGETARALGMEAPPPDLGLTVTHRDPAAREVALVGSFNGWDPTQNPLSRQGKEWSLTLGLPEGLHQYQVWVDGEMKPPQQCGRWLDDGFGGKNCAVLIAAKGTGGER